MFGSEQLCLTGPKALFLLSLRIIKMDKRQLLKFIKESRELIKTSTPEQQLRLLKLIKESYKQLHATKITESEIMPLNDSDYLDE